MAAHTLTQKGISCLMLDAGPLVDFPRQRVTKAVHELPYRGFGKPGRLAHVVQANEFNANQWVDETQVPYTHDPEEPYNWVRVRMIGGKSLFWARMSFRLSDYEFKAKDHDGFGDNWPIGLDDLAPYYARVEEIFQVSGAADGPRLAAGKREDARHVDEQHRHVKQIVGPIAPARQEPVRFAELFPRPEVDPALSRIAARQGQHGNRFRHEEGDEREHPQSQGCPAVDGNGRDIIDVDDRDDLQQDEVPPAERPRDVERLLHAHRSKTTRPPTSVISTVRRVSAPGDSASGLPESTAKSAHFPTSMLPRLASSPVAMAPPIV